ncbi:MAG: peptide chain release factor 2 [Clostridia bacterium]|nr:peptide chain release factor 2 [Clostridia bacterium]
MIIIEDYKQKFQEFKKDLENLEKALKISALRQQIEEDEALTAAPGFWDDLQNSQKVLQVIKNNKKTVENFEKMVSAHEDLGALLEMAEMEPEEMEEDVVREFDAYEKQLEQANLQTLLSGEFDQNNAIITFHAGAGGTEAQDWVEMLYRMYLRFAQRHEYKVTVLDYLDGDEAGIKSASILVEGQYAYGYLKSEMGVHRLVRVSPFDASGRRQTSFASVEVMPEIDDSVEVEIRPEDIKMEVFRSSGAGGQKVNKTSSAVRLIHLPTGITVSCQNERSQFQNRDMCMKMLKAKLIEIKERENLEKIEDIKGDQMSNGWGSQIRSYVFMPYTLAKDHRTNFEMGNINAVMDGDIDGFINAYLIYLSHK